MTIYDLAFEEDHTELYSLLSNPSTVVDPVKNYLSKGKVTPKRTLRKLITTIYLDFSFIIQRIKSASRAI